MGLSRQGRSVEWGARLTRNRNPSGRPSTASRRIWRRAPPNTRSVTRSSRPGAHREIHEIVGRDNGAVRLHPSGQQLGTDDHAGAGVELRLEERDDVAVVDGPSKSQLEVDPVRGSRERASVSKWVTLLRPDVLAR